MSYEVPEIRRASGDETGGTSSRADAVGGSRSRGRSTHGMSRARRRWV